MKQARVYPKSIIKVTQGTFATQPDLLATEEPLEMRLQYLDDHSPREVALNVTMRTPGDDEELTLGFLLTEGIIKTYSDIKSIAFCKKQLSKNNTNTIKIQLAAGLIPDSKALQRNFRATASCGLCGKQTIAQIACDVPSLIDHINHIEPILLYQLPQKLSEAQAIFSHTGGIHAAALFSKNGALLQIKEDIGRHNAMDKIIGATLRDHPEILQNTILLISSRIGYELVQKAAVARISIVAAIGAPSSLAVQLAEKMGITLIGFLRNEGFNIYTVPWRVKRPKNPKTSKAISLIRTIKT